MTSYNIIYTGFLTVVEGYSDANWTLNSKDLRATTGHVFTLSGGAIAWKSSKHTLITRYGGRTCGSKTGNVRA